jgi:hypothetical protein
MIPARMRRALVVLAVLIVVAGAFAAGALIFRGGDDNVVESEVHCVETVEEGGSDDDCGEVFGDEKRALCSADGYDAVKITIIYETQYEGDTEEDGRRTFTEDC